MKSPAAKGPSTTRRSLLLLTAAGAGGWLVYRLVAGPSQAQSQVRRAAAAFTSEPNEAPERWLARLRDELQALLSNSVEVSLSDGTRLQGKAQVVASAEDFVRSRERWYVDVQRIEQPSGSRAIVLAVLSDTQRSGDLHGQPRRFDVTFSDGGDSQRIERVEVGPAGEFEPEERP